MNIMLYAILAILFIHWFADFVLQTDKQAKGKSKNWNDLLTHTAVYSGVWLLVCNTLILMYWLPNTFYLFAPITFVFHTATDYTTSRVNSKLWEAGKTHNFFVSLGFDQLLHHAQLFITFWVLMY
jgi:Protein of unknown function (DUF3307)